MFRAGCTVSEDGVNKFQIFGQAYTEQDAIAALDRKLQHFDHIHTTYEICQTKHP